jgi:hypothetical protein
LDDRNFNPESGAAVRIIFRTYGASVLLDKLFTDRQSQSGSLRLGREERLEDFLEDVFTYAFASVGDGDFYRRG